MSRFTSLPSLLGVSCEILAFCTVALGIISERRRRGFAADLVQQIRPLARVGVAGSGVAAQAVRAQELSLGPLKAALFLNWVRHVIPEDWRER